MYLENRRARFDFKFEETTEAGISLTGREVKAIKSGKADMTRAYARLMGDEMFLINLVISDETGSTSDRKKLLLHKKEITLLASKIKAQGLTLVPVCLYAKGAFIKVKLALAKHRKKKELRGLLRQRDLEKEAQKELKSNWGR